MIYARNYINLICMDHMKESLKKHYEWKGKLEVSSLRTMPNRYPLTPEEPWRSEGIHKMSVENFLVYYWVNESEKIVWVTVVVYGRRDQLQTLRDMPKDKC